MANNKGFDFSLLPTLCQDKVITESSITDLLNMMENDPAREEQIKSRKIQSGGYHLKFTSDGGLQMPGKNYEWKWQRLERRYMVEDILKQFDYLKAIFPGEVTTVEVEKYYIPAVLESGKIDKVQNLLILNGLGDHVPPATIEKFLESVEISEKLDYGITVPRLKVELIKDIPIVNLHYAGWLGAPDLMKMNSSYMSFERTVFTSAQLNEFLTKWFNSRNSVLTKASFGHGRTLNEDTIFRGLYKKHWDPENKNRTDYPGPPASIAKIVTAQEPKSVIAAMFDIRDLSGAFELRRPDGVLASIELRDRRFEFVVHWTEPFKNTQLNNSFNAEILKYQARIDRNNEYLERKRTAPESFNVQPKKLRVDEVDEEEKQKEENASKMEDLVLMAENARNLAHINGLKANLQLTENGLQFLMR